MLKAIEWRSLFGALLILAGCGLGKLMSGVSLDEYLAAGILATVIPTFLVGVYLKIFGIPIRTSLQLLSLPVGFYVSLLITYQGDIDSRFFEAGVYAAIGGGFLTLCSYRDESIPALPEMRIDQTLPAILLLILAPVGLIYSIFPKIIISFYYQPSDVVIAFSALFGIVLLQNKEKERYQRYQFAGCYATVLSTALAIATALQYYYLIHISSEEIWKIDVTEQVGLGLTNLGSLLFGTAFYSVIVLVSITKSKTEGIMLKNWHLSEAYIFLTFMLIAPQSLYETIANAAS